MSNLDFARAAKLCPIAEIAAKAGIPASALEPYGRFKAKIGFDFIRSLPAHVGKLVLVTGISPTAAGEGKTTTTVGLGDALNRLGARTMICLREPSLGPIFGQKGGATGGGRSQVVPMEEINLHFTGDFHAITAANNLLAAMIDNHVYWGNSLGIDTRRISFRRALDVNDRALRRIVIGLNGGLGSVANGFPSENGFDITAASEVMALFCLATDLEDLRVRLGRIIVATRTDGTPITARDLKADGAMAALLRDALAPNLVQTIDGSPALVHGGPFANIAHGCNSVIATRLGLSLADIVVTEAGFGADLGAEKFFDIKCRSAGIVPGCAVIVASVRALKMHGGIAKSALNAENTEAVARGVANLVRHVENVEKFGLPTIVALNRFSSDTPAEFAVIQGAMAALGTEAVLCTNWSDGAAGAADLARAVQARLAAGTARFAPIYPSAMPLVDKLRTVAREIYRAADIHLPATVLRKLDGYEAAGFGHLAVCIAKTQYSFSADPTVMGAPIGHILPVRDVRLSAGAGFVVAFCGDILTMPGLPRAPASEAIYLNASGEIEGLL